MTAHFHAHASRERPARFALFAYGFRPFFLGAGIYAVVAIVAWLAVLRTGAWPDTGGDPMAWHAHEMLFGFTAAAVAGFMLTAVPNWTGVRGYSGPKLAGLVFLWLAGRVVVSPILSIPPALAAVVDVAFFPALALMVLPSIIAAKNRRNYVFLGMIALLTAGSALYHLDRLDVAPGAWETGRGIAIYVVLLMVALVGGRIIPSFTSSALRRENRPVEIHPGGWVDKISLGLIVALGIADTVQPGGASAGTLALLAGLGHAVRLSRWHGLKTFRQPILWILHVAYAWVPVGLLLKACWDLGGLEIGIAWVHAITLGAFATMILAVMSRASLGHTGRDLVAAKPTVLAYILLTIATLVRVAAPAVGEMSHAYAVAGGLWVIAFALFTLVYTPILVLPRADGRPG